MQDGDGGKRASNKAVFCSGDKVLREISGNSKGASKSTQRSNVINVVFKGIPLAENRANQSAQP